MFDFSLWDIFSGFFVSLAQFAIGCVVKLLDLLKTNFNDLLSTGAVKGYFSFLEIFASLLFIIGIGFAIAEWAISTNEGNGDNILSTFKYIILGLVTTLGFITIPVLLMQFTIECTQALISGIATSSIQTNLNDQLALIDFVADAATSPIPVNTIITIVYIIVIIVSAVKVFLGNLKRSGVLIILLTVCPLHIFSIPRGYVDAFFGWCKQVIALFITTFVQNFLLALGILVLTTGGAATFSTTGECLSMGILLSASDAPRVLQQFGMDTSIRASASQAIFATSGLTNIIRTFV